MNTFAELPLQSSLQRALSSLNYTVPTPIQSQAIPVLVEGRDLIATADTGSGKTACFALPILQACLAEEEPSQRKKGQVKSLILVPTRELASQVMASFKRYGKFTGLRYCAIYGGVRYARQIDSLKNGVDVLVATPGRLLDLLGQNHIKLDTVSYLVLDEADRMLDMGFSKDLEKIVKLIPSKHQTILFSATMPESVVKFAKRIVSDPVELCIANKKTELPKIDERLVFVHKDNKNDAMFALLGDDQMERVIVFTKTKHVADRLAKKLKAKKFKVDAIHGDKRQNVRERSLRQFRQGAIKVLVATDVAARGIDVANVSHVINYQLSEDTENYVHRIGRTARAGQSGIAYTLCDNEDFALLTAIEQEIKRDLPTSVDSPYFDSEIAERYAEQKERKQNSKQPHRNSRSRKGRFGGGKRGASSNGRSSGGRFASTKSTRGASSRRNDSGEKSWGADSSESTRERGEQKAFGRSKPFKKRDSQRGSSASGNSQKEGYKKDTSGAERRASSGSDAAPRAARPKAAGQRRAADSGRPESRNNASRPERSSRSATSKDQKPKRAVKWGSQDKRNAGGGKPGDAKPAGKNGRKGKFGQKKSGNTSFAGKRTFSGKKSSSGRSRGQGQRPSA